MEKKKKEAFSKNKEGNKQKEVVTANEKATKKT